MSVLKTGNIRFVQSCPPALDAGDYTLTVEQKVNAPGSGPLPAHKAQFAVKAPRFSLDPAHIHAMYPPANHMGNFDSCLPHIIFNIRTLPWEVSLDGTPVERAANQDGSETTPPWLALLCFGEDENPEIQNITAGELGSPPAGVEPPPISPDANAGESSGDPCLVIDIPIDLFLAIAPKEEELHYLAHSRQVHTDCKETGAAVSDGWFSTVVCNRFPDSDAIGIRNTAHLVSLEGLGSYLPGGGKTFDSSVKYVRLISLATWSFTGVQSKMNFKELIDGLSVGRLALKSPLPDNSPSTKSVSQALSMGYVPMNQTTRQGGKTVSWYRGPFVPLDIKKEGKNFYNSADAALRYNPETGMFDISYAAAWQLGRLLALGSRNFAVSLLQWRRKSIVYEVLNRSQAILETNTGTSLRLTEKPGNPSNRKAVNRATLNFLTSEIGPGLNALNNIESELGENVDSSGLNHVAASLPGLLSEKEMDEIRSSGADPNSAAINKVLGEGQ